MPRKGNANPESHAQSRLATELTRAWDWVTMRVARMTD
jgi:hypothetical protein